MINDTLFLEKTRFSHICLILFFIFSVKFSFLPLNSTRLVLLYCLAALFIFKKERLTFTYNRQTISAFSLLILYGLYTAISTLYSGGDNLGNLLNIILILFQIGFTSYLLVFFFIGVDLDQFLFLLLIIFGIQGVLIFLNFIFPSYREFMFTVMPVGGNITEDNFTSAFRTRGLMQSSGATVSAFLALGFLIGAYFLTTFKLSQKDKKIVLICLPWILIGIVFTGRTGFLMIPLALCAYYVLLIINRRFKLKNLLVLLYLPLGAILMYLLVKETYMFISPKEAVLIQRWESWAFDQFLVNFSGDKGKISTLETLQSYVFIPEDDTHLLLGDPLSWGVVRTDVGYIRMLYSVGVVGSILFYGGFLQIFYHIIKNVKSFSLQVLLGFILLWLLIIEYKEPMFMAFFFTSTIMLLLFFNMKDIRG